MAQTLCVPPPVIGDLLVYLVCKSDAGAVQPAHVHGTMTALLSFPPCSALHAQPRHQDAQSRQLRSQPVPPLPLLLLRLGVGLGVRVRLRLHITEHAAQLTGKTVHYKQGI